MLSQIPCLNKCEITLAAFVWPEYIWRTIGRRHEVALCNSLFRSASMGIRKQNEYLNIFDEFIVANVGQGRCWRSMEISDDDIHIWVCSRPFPGVCFQMSPQIACMNPRWLHLFFHPYVTHSMCFEMCVRIFWPPRAVAQGPDPDIP